MTQPAMTQMTVPEPRLQRLTVRLAPDLPEPRWGDAIDRPHLTRTLQLLVAVRTFPMVDGDGNPTDIRQVEGWTITIDRSWAHAYLHDGVTRVHTTVPGVSGPRANGGRLAEITDSRLYVRPKPRRPGPRRNTPDAYLTVVGL
jgi:hypothetical protein